MGEGECDMRVSRGVPCGRIVLPYNPELFNEHEEVIIFTREEFKNRYNSVMDFVRYIFKVDGYLKTGKDFLLLGYWSDIMEIVKLIELNINLIFDRKPIQTCLDVYLYGTITDHVDVVGESESKVPAKLRTSIYL